MTTYVKTTWNTGDVITAAKLNNLETQYDDVMSGATFTGLIAIQSYSLNAASVSISSNTLTVNLATQNVVPFTFNANITTTTLSNIPASGKFASITFIVIGNGGTPTWAWLTGTVKWAGGTAPTFTYTSAKIDVFFVWTKDGGTNWYGSVVSQNS